MIWLPHKGKEYQKWLKKSEALLNSERFEEAIECYDKALSLKSDSNDAWFGKGYCLSSVQRFEEAIQCYDKALEIEPNGSDIWYGKAGALHGLGKYEEAIECLDKAIEIEPDNPDLHYNKGSVLYDLDKYEEAIQCYDKAIEIQPDYYLAWRGKGEAWNSLQNLDEAINCFDKVIQAEPNDFITILGKSSILYRLGKYQIAVEYCDKALVIDPKSADAWFAKGRSLEGLDKYEEALKCYEKALDINPNSTILWHYKGLCYCKLGKHLKGFQSFDEALRIDPQNMDIWMTKGEIYLKLFRAEEAVNCFDKALEVEPGNENIWIAKGDALGFLGEGRSDERIKCYEKAIELNPNYAGAWYNKAHSLLHQRQLGTYSDYFHKPEIDDSNSDTRNRFGIVLEHLDKAIELNPKYAEAWSDRGEALCSLGRYDEAIKCYDKAIELDDKYGDDMSMLLKQSAAFANLGECGKAIELCDKAIEKDPSEIYLMSDLADLLNELGNYEEAIRCYDRVIEEAPKHQDAELFDSLTYSVWKYDSSAQYSKGEILYKIGKYDEAIDCYNKVIEVYPDDTRIWTTKGDALYNLGRHEEAIRCYDRILDIDSNDVDTWRKKGQSLYNLGRHEEAIRCYDRIRMIRPGNVRPVEDPVKPVDNLDYYVAGKIQSDPDASISQLYNRVCKYLDDGDLESVRSYAQQGLALCKSDRKEMQAAFLDAIGRSYALQGREFEAYDFYMKASKICPADTSLSNNIKVNIGNLFQYLWNRPDDAKTYYESINQKDFEKNDVYGYLDLLLRLADLEGSQGKFQNALELVKNKVIPKALSELSTRKVVDSTTQKFSTTLLEALIRKAYYSHRLFLRNGTIEDYETAVDSLTDATKYNYSYLYQTRILSDWAAIELETANKYMHKRLRSGHALQAKELEDSFIKPAKSKLEESLLLSESIGNKEMVAEISIKLSICYQLLGNARQAEELLKKALEITDQVIVIGRSSEIRIGSKMFKLLHEALSNLCWLMVKQGRIWEALSYVEIGRAREMFNDDLLQRHLANENSEKKNLVDKLNLLDVQLQTIVAKRKQLQENIDMELGKDYKVITSKDMARLYPQKIRELNELDAAHASIFQTRQDIENEIWQRYPDLGATLPKDPCEFVDRFITLSKALTKDHANSRPWALMEFSYVPREENLLVFLLDNSLMLTVSSVYLSQDDWEFNFPRLVNSFRKKFVEGSYDEAEKILLQAARKLSSIIPTEIINKLKELKAEQLIVIPDGILHNMPFELMRENEGPMNECWGIKYKLIREFGINHLSSQLQTNVVTSPNALIAGNPTKGMLIPKKEIYPFLETDAYWPADLPKSEDEANNIGTILRNNRGQPALLLNTDASKDRFIEKANSTSYSIIHFAGHAMFDSNNPDLSFLMLNNSEGKLEKLYANEIPVKIYLNGSPIVILSSCESGMSEIKIGDEAFGLVRGFTLAGASNLILSGWWVFDHSSKDFMESFYSTLLQGFSISEALSCARLEVLNRVENGKYRYRLPALYFGPFQLWGSPFRKVQFR